MAASASSVMKSIKTAAETASVDRDATRLTHIFPASTHEIPAGMDILRTGHRCADAFILRRGWAFIYHALGSGRRQILHFALPGEILNPCTATSHAATESIQALTDAALSALPHEQLDAAMRMAPDIASQVAMQVERDRLLAYQHMTNIGRRSARERIANLLLELFCRVRRRLPDRPNDTAAMPLTQAVIADALGLTAVHVNRTLRNLRNEGIAQLRHGELLVLDHRRLIEVADFSGEVLALMARTGGAAEPVRLR
jgi:CRP/FNR family transcriptional regulator, anaerobic regulatory protein